MITLPKNNRLQTRRLVHPVVKKSSGPTVLKATVTPYTNQTNRLFASPLQNISVQELVSTVTPVMGSAILQPIRSTSPLQHIRSKKPALGRSNGTRALLRRRKTRRLTRRRR